MYTNLGFVIDHEFGSCTRNFASGRDGYNEIHYKKTSVWRVALFILQRYMMGSVYRDTRGVHAMLSLLGGYQDVHNKYHSFSTSPVKCLCW